MDQLVLWVNVVTFALMVAAAGLIYLVHIRTPHSWLIALVAYTGTYSVWLLFGTFTYVQAVFLSAPLPTLSLVFAYVRLPISFLVLAAGSRFFLQIGLDPWRRSADLVPLVAGVITAAMIVASLGFKIILAGRIATALFNGYFATLAGIALAGVFRAAGPRRRLIPFLGYSLVAYVVLSAISVFVMFKPVGAYAGIPLNVIASGVFTSVWGVVVLVIATRWIVSGSISDGGVPRAFVADFGLSPRECDVVRVIRSGATSKEIGETLFISQRTVEVHLQSVYRKCGVTNRVELVNLIARYSGASRNE